MSDFENKNTVIVDDKNILFRFVGD